MTTPNDSPPGDEDASERGRRRSCPSPEATDALREVLGRNGRKPNRPLVAPGRPARPLRAPGRETSTSAEDRTPVLRSRKESLAGLRAADPAEAPVVHGAADPAPHVVVSDLRRDDAGQQATTDRLVRDVVMAGISAGSVRAPLPGRRDHGAPGGDDDDEVVEARRSGWSDEEVDEDVVLRAARGALREDDPDADAIAAESLPPQSKNILTAFGGVLNNFVTETGEMTTLAGMVIKSAVTHPRGYWGEVRDVMYDAIKLCWIPMIISVTAFGLGAPGLQGGNILYLFGVPDRLGGFFMFASIREFAPWIDAMVIAGVVGTAITADLGARRIREEIDAMEVLGVDPVRHLVLPRVIGAALITGFFDIFALLFGILGGYIASVGFLGSSPSGYVASFFTESNITDDWSSLVKTFLFGGIIGIVCCYKGLKAKGGPAGVGRAVNQAVVVSFALIWIVNYAFTNIMLGYAPSTQVIK